MNTTPIKPKPEERTRCKDSDGSERKSALVFKLKNREIMEIHINRPFENKIMGFTDMLHPDEIDHVIAFFKSWGFKHCDQRSG